MVEIVWYEGDPSGWALILPPGIEDGKADLLLFPEEGGGPHQEKDAVPHRAEGGGHTWRYLP